MTPLERTLHAAIEDLKGLGARFALVGGLAVSVRAEPRFTRDVDLVVAVSTDREAEAIVRALLGRGYRVLAQVEQEAVRRLATVRLQPPGPDRIGLVVDLLFASSGIEIEIVARAEEMTLALKHYRDLEVDLELQPDGSARAFFRRRNVRKCAMGPLGELLPGQVPGWLRVDLGVDLVSHGLLVPDGRASDPLYRSQLEAGVAPWNR